MKIEEILQARINRKERSARPFANFFENCFSCIKAGKLVISGSVSDELKTLISRSAIITTVSAVEVYYKDILDFIFRYCKPEFFKPHLKILHPEKYDIPDIVDFFENDINPYELISSNQSFQNVDKINKVFSLFLPRGFWHVLFESKFALAPKKEMITEDRILTWSQKELDGMKRIFKLRHQIIHDPTNNFEIKSNHIADLDCTMHIILGSDLILGREIEKNKK